MPGTNGSTLVAELNRLANGGTYPALGSYRAEAGAANIWAGTAGLDLQGALNKKVNINRTPDNYKGLWAVCNELASTTNLSPSDALRTM